MARLFPAKLRINSNHFVQRNILPCPQGWQPFVDWTQAAPVIQSQDPDKGVFLARVGPHAQVPLPAIILGADGERSVDATLDWEDLRGLWEVLTHTSLGEVLNTRAAALRFVLQPQR